MWYTCYIVESGVLCLEYTTLSDQELENIGQKYYGQFGQYLADASLSLEHKSLDYLAKKSNLGPALIQELHMFIKESLSRQFKSLAMLEYLIMEKTKDFGSMGEQRVSISFCRNLLNIPNDREVTQFDADRFRRLIDEFDQTMQKRSGEQYRDIYKTGNVSFLGVKVSYTGLAPIIQYLTLLKSPYQMYVTYNSQGLVNLIFGEMIEKKLGNYTVMIFEKEYIRTPSLVLSIAAENASGEKIMIRRESCEVIFFNKWQKFYEQSKAERKRALRHVNSSVREGVKERALQLYGAKTTEEVKKIKNTFIEDMIDGIIWHEIGHKVTKQKQNPQYGKFAGAVFESSDKLPSVLNEALADWAPLTDQVKGAVARFRELARVDKARAQRELYVYLSDNWFVDESEEFMALQTDILTALVLHFMNIQGEFDFERYDRESPKIYDFLLKAHEQLMQELVGLLEKATYDVGIHKLSYAQLKTELLKMYKNDKLVATEDQMLEKPNYWMNLWGYARKFSPQTYQQVNDYIATNGNDFRLKLLKIFSKNDPGRFNNSLREFIVARFTEIGVIKPAVRIDTTIAVRKACETMRMPEKIMDKVQEKFKKIMDGEPHDISISYEGEKDPFIATVQEMLIKSGYGDITAGMTVGELYSPDDPPEKRKQFIKEELENIRDQLESEMYLEIDLLKVNDVYNVKPMVEELLDTVVFFDSKKLREKIKTVQYVPLSSGALFEVVIPLKRGYMDWNTSQAVWRINQDIRPEEFIMQWTIDKEFIESLVEAYQ